MLETQQQQQPIPHRQKYNQVPNDSMCHEYTVTYYWPPLEVFSLHNLFLYSDMPPPCHSSPWLADAILSQIVTYINILAISSQLSSSLHHQWRWNRHSVFWIVCT